MIRAVVRRVAAPEREDIDLIRLLSTFFIDASAIKPFLPPDVNAKRILTRLRTRSRLGRKTGRPDRVARIVGAVVTWPDVSRIPGCCGPRREFTVAKHSRASRIPCARSSATTFHFRGRNDAAPRLKRRSRPRAGSRARLGLWHRVRERNLK